MADRDPHTVQRAARMVGLPEPAQRIAAQLDHLMRDALDQAHAAGYAAAVANLRDDQRFEAWRWEHAHHVSGFRVARGHAADYLEAVGPGASGQVEP